MPIGWVFLFLNPCPRACADLSRYREFRVNGLGSGRAGFIGAPRGRVMKALHKDGTLIPVRMTVDEIPGAKLMYSGRLTIETATTGDADSRSFSLLVLDGATYSAGGNVNFLVDYDPAALEDVPLENLIQMPGLKPEEVLQALSSLSDPDDPTPRDPAKPRYLRAVFLCQGGERTEAVAIERGRPAEDDPEGSIPLVVWVLGQLEGVLECTGAGIITYASLEVQVLLGFDEEARARQQATAVRPGCFCSTFVQLARCAGRPRVPPLLGGAFVSALSTPWPCAAVGLTIVLFHCFAHAVSGGQLCEHPHAAFDRRRPRRRARQVRGQDGEQRAPHRRLAQGGGRSAPRRQPAAPAAGGVGRGREQARGAGVRGASGDDGGGAVAAARRAAALRLAAIRTDDAAGGANQEEGEQAAVGPRGNRQQQRAARGGGAPLEAPPLPHERQQGPRED